MDQHVKLAQSLHPRLLHLFTRWPPLALSRLAPSAQAVQGTTTTTETTSPSDPNATTSISSPIIYATKKLNPFRPWKNPRTGNWHGAHYSLRRQAELYKLAQQYGVLSLMPRSPKHPEEKEKKRLERGVRVKGTGVGQRVKGHKWERSLNERLDKRREAMAGMPQMIKDWKQAGRGRGWKKWPK
ncbi:hypothetical protein AMS68_005974 [Peltaster fructicola]|uniref:Large ribosomal subunit protein mL59 domain-containing protein n=1 Tax=Peltaster fructicola TaxID=286661 RepID=A0A6H0Y0C8_9PEZI|nr:hypothetical protein AMS68_005974 [Peltaster fructicola]